MRTRFVVAAVTGWFYRLAARHNISTSASRQAALQAARLLPDAPGEVSAGSGSLPELRVVLIGNGVAESPGAADSATAFPTHLARPIVARTGRRVRVTTLVGAAWDLSSFAAQLQDLQLHWRDALVVSAAYRAQLAEIPLKSWAVYTEALRAMLVESAGTDVVIRVLSLPWRRAARNQPMHWGGLFGNRVRVVAEIAERTLTPDQPAKILRLHEPALSTEWVGPVFSGQTYLRWADQVAAELATAWRL